jgi:membrane protein insertase, YidC/Oxa1 family, N-terminal domain
MESARTFLWLTCGVLIMFLFIEWNDPGEVQTPETTQESSLMQAPADSASDPRLSSESFRDDLPSISANNSVITPNTTSKRSETITLSNNVLSISVDTKGADIVAAKLLKYYPSKNEQDKNVDLMYMNDTISDFHRLQSGLLLTNGAKSPTHIENYSLISKGRSKLTFILESETTRTTKTLTLNPDSYLVNISFLLENMTDEQVSYIPYYQLVKDNVEFERSMFDVESYSFDGGIIFDGDSYEKQYAEDLIDEPYKKTHTNGWLQT